MDFQLLVLLGHLRWPILLECGWIPGDVSSGCYECGQW